VLRFTPHFVCSDIRVSDLVRAIHFYKLLGLEVIARDRMQDGTHVVWMRDRTTGQMLELFQLSSRSPVYRPFRRRAGTGNALIFGVPEPATVLARLCQSGAKVIADFQEKGVRLLFLRDPDGNRLELLSWMEHTRDRHRLPPLVGLASSRRGRPRSHSRPERD